MASGIFAENFKEEPYWLEEAPWRPVPDTALPKAADALIVGSGYTGLSAALTLARAGRNVLVLEASELGYGCSSRNGGMVGGLLKVAPDELARRYGKDRAVALLRESLNALEYTAHLVRSENIACHFARTGKFLGAWRPGHYEKLARALDFLRRELGYDADMVPKAEQRREIGSDLFYGGRVENRQAALHPALYQRGLLERAISAGATVIGRTPVLGVVREKQGFAVQTPKGRIAAREVIVATNGYTTGALRFARRRLIPVGSYMIATEPLGPGLMDRLIPKRRMIVDTRKMVGYYRPSPDGTRMLFGTRISYREMSPRAAAPGIHALMARIFPELAGTKITHAWRGFVAMTFDRLPHLGRHKGIHYAAGYNGSGVAPSTYLGHKIALKVLGSPEGRTAFDELEFPARPYYFGWPWFLPVASLGYLYRDRFGR